MTQSKLLQSFFVLLGIQSLLVWHVISTDRFSYFTGLFAILIGVVFLLTLIPLLISFLMLKNQQLYPEEGEKYRLKGRIAYGIFLGLNISAIVLTTYRIMSTGHGFF